MKKTLLATAIAGAMVATGAQAATVYDQDGTKLDVYGRLVYAVTTGGPEGAEAKQDGSEFVDLGSRWGFRASHDVTSDLSTYARMEFRGKADARNNAGFDTIRNTYVGVNSDSWGDVRIGNFSSIFYQMVSVVHDIPENAGATNLDFGGVSFQGDSIQYTTPNLTGFQAAVAAKHMSGNGAEHADGTDNGSSLSWHAGVSYEINDLYLGLAYNQSKQPGENDGFQYDGAGPSAGGPKPFSEDLLGFAANYNITPALSARFTYQDVTDVTVSQADLDAMGEPVFEIDNLWGIGGSYDYGMGEIYADYYRVDMIDERVDEQDRWVLGANYRFSEPMYVFAEFYQEDSSTGTDQTLEENFRNLDDDVLTTVGVRYDF